LHRGRETYGLAVSTPQDFFVAKVKSDGTLDWVRAIGGTGDDWATCVRQTADGGYLFAGHTSGGTGERDLAVVKCDSSGNTVWARLVGQTQVVYGNTVALTSDGGCVATSSNTSGGGYITKLSGSGALVWTRLVGGGGYSNARIVGETADADLLIAGATQVYGAGGYDAWLMKTAADGTMAGCSTITTVTPTGHDTHAGQQHGIRHVPERVADRQCGLAHGPDDCPGDGLPLPGEQRRARGSGLDDRRGERQGGRRHGGAAAKLHVAGTAGVDGIMFPDGTLQTTAITSVPANKVRVVAQGSRSVTATCPSGMTIEAGWYYSPGNGPRACSAGASSCTMSSGYSDTTVVDITCH